MVRSVVGVLVDAGSGRIDADAVSHAVESRDRSRVPRLAPAQGLTLERVVYGGPSRRVP
jgi:tRNA pseudouridine38-40 synthase